MQIRERNEEIKELGDIIRYLERNEEQYQYSIHKKTQHPKVNEKISKSLENQYRVRYNNLYKSNDKFRP